MELQSWYEKNIAVLAIVVVWTLSWKTYSVWIAARRGDKKWFIALLILNTFALLDIIYIFYIAKISWKEFIHSMKGMVGVKG